MTVSGATPLNALAIREALSRTAKEGHEYRGHVDWQAPEFDLAIGNRIYKVSAQHVFNALDACGLPTGEIIATFKELGIELTETNIPNRRRVAQRPIAAPKVVILDDHRPKG